MPPRDDKQPLVSSVLDRLLDDEPQHHAEQPRSAGQTVRQLKLAVRRDLENLLNTRRRCTNPPPGLTGLVTSLTGYGIPDCTGMNMSLPTERERMRLAIERVIVRFEPRLKNVVVTATENVDEFDRTLRLRITGVLHTAPTPLPVVFDSELEPSSASVEVKATR